MDYGIFTSFWDGRPNHLSFLNLQQYSGKNDEDVRLSKSIPKEEQFDLAISTSLLKAIIIRSDIEYLKSGVDLLLNDDDWRPHLVALFAICFIDKVYNTNLVSRLWDRLGFGSWVSPQICVVLSYLDDNFDANAKNVINSGANITYKNILLPQEEHTLRSPAGKNFEQKKYLQALRYLVEGIIKEDDDTYNGGKIAQSWEIEFNKYYKREIEDKEI